MSEAPASTLGGHVELGVEADLNAVWRETPTAEIEGGRVDAVTAHVWGNALSRQLVIDTGSQLRRLHLAAEDDGDPTATQLFVWGGLPSGTPATFKDPTPGKPDAAWYTP